MLAGTVELHASGLIGTSHLYMQKTQIIGFFFSNYTKLALQSLAVTIYSMYLRLILLTMPDFEGLEAITLYHT